MRIKNNISGLNTTRRLSNTSKKQAKVSEKLSSGLRINRAADDAAGLAISEKMRAQIRGLDTASRNAQDGISLIQTAEGALGEVHSMLQRVRELSVQAGNDTYSLDDRETIQKEINQLVNEIDDISVKTEFNGIKLLDGTAGKTRTMSLKEVLEDDSDNLNIIYIEDRDDFKTTTSGHGNATAPGHDPLKNTLQAEIVPQAVTGILNTYKSAFGYLSSSSIGIGLKIYNDSSTNTLASVGIGYSYTSDNKVVTNMLTYQLAVNTSTLVFDGSGNLTEDSRTALETTIVHEMMHAMMDESLTNGMVGVTNGTMDSSNSFPKWFKEGMAQTAAGGYSNSNDWVNGNLGIVESTSEADISSIVTNGSNSLKSGSTASNYGTGYLACMYLGYMAGGNDTNKISQGLDTVLSELVQGNSLNDVIKDISSNKYSGIADFQNKFGDVDSSKFIKELTKIVGDKGNGGLVGNNKLIDSDLLPNAPISTNLFKLDTTNDTVKNIYPDGLNIFSGGGSVSTGKDISGKFTPVIGSSGGVSGGVSILDDGIILQIGDKSGQTMTISIGEVDRFSLGINNLSVLNNTDAGRAITATDNAIKNVSEIRAKLGAYQNRLEHAMSNLNNSSENIQASESRIRDMDMAKGMMEYSKNLILMQATQSILAQVNQEPQKILSLLQ